MKKEFNEEWINDTALLFYQIFSADYTNEKFEKKLLQGGGGNSALCSTWIKLSENFVKYRVSKGAYELLISIINGEDRNLIVKKGKCVTIPANFIKKKYAYLFSSNAKGAEKRKKNGQYFHLDHNPSNKKVLTLLKNIIKNNKEDKEKFLKSLALYIKNIQTVDLIRVEEDDIRTQKDFNLTDKMDSIERDEILGSEFYDLILK